MESDITEVCFHETGFEICDADCRICNIDAESVSESFDGGFGGTNAYC